MRSGYFSEKLGRLINNHIFNNLKLLDLVLVLVRFLQQILKSL